MQILAGSPTIGVSRTRRQPFRGPAAILLGALVAIVLAGCGPPAPAAENDDAGGAVSEPLDQQLPEEINGVAIESEVTSAENPDSVTGLSVDEELLGAIVEMGGSRSSVEVGFAYDPTGQLPASIVALRAPGADPGRLRDQFLATVAEETGEQLEERTVGGREVMAGRTNAGTGYLYFRGDTVFQVFTESEEAAAAILSALP